MTDSQSAADGARDRSVLLSASEAAHAAHLLKILLSTDMRSLAEPALASADTALERGQLEDMARRIFQARKARDIFLRPGLLREQAWDMLLALYARASTGLPSYVVEVTKLAGASITTGLRYLATLEKSSLVERHTSGSDQRMVEVRLTTEGIRLMDRYFEYLVEMGLGPSTSSPDQ